MSGINYKDEVKCFIDDLGNYNVKLMDINTNKIGLCKKINSLELKRSISSPIEERELEDIFLSSLFKLGEKTGTFYYEKAPLLRVVRDDELKNGEAFLIGNEFHQQVILTSKQYNENDAVAYSHELGHLPSMLKIAHDSYYEYMECFPILLEYFTLEELHSRNTFELFLKSRLKISKAMAKDYLSYDRKIQRNNSYKDKYYELQKREIYKYLVSLDFVISLIEKYQDDKYKVSSLLDRYVTGEKSLRDIVNYFNLKPEECRKLNKVIDKKVIVQ